MAYPNAGETRFLSLLTGSFSTPAGGNPTVAMVAAAYRDLGLQAAYLNCEVSAVGLADAVRGARAMGWAGFNCSLPHKQAVIAHLDGLAPSAELIGAVNCVVRREVGGMARWIGENTDGQGFVASLRERVDPAGKHLVLLGAGGAARAIAVEAALAGATRLTIFNRDPARANELANLINQRTAARAVALPWRGLATVPGDADVLVNATSVGLAPDVDARMPLDLDSLRPGMLVADVIPNPPRTALIREAEARGCATLDGLGMLVNQAVVSIALWTGRQANPVVMRAALQASLA